MDSNFSTTYENGVASSGNGANMTTTYEAEQKTRSSDTFQLEESSPLRETHSDPFAKPRWLRNASGLSLLVGGMISFSVVITIALIVQILVGTHQLTPHAVVISEDESCSQIGLDYMKKTTQSSAKHSSESITIDAAILTSLCLSIKNPHLGGLGGGGFMIIQRQHLSKNDTLTIDFREMSPQNIQEPTVDKSKVEVVKTVAVPGFIRGLKAAHDLFGSTSWELLLRSASRLAASNVTVNDKLAAAIDRLDINNISQSLKSLVSESNKKKVKGDTLTQNDLSDTLNNIAVNADSFYNGKLADALIKVIPDITKEDLASYTSEVQYDPLKVAYPENTVVGVKPPASSFVTLSTLNTLYQFRTSVNTEEDKNLQIHRMLETLKYAYADLSTLGGSSNNASRLLTSEHANEIKMLIANKSVSDIPKYLNGINMLDLNTGGEQHVSLMGSDGYVVTVVMSIGTEFGSKLMTSGYVLNNALLDFSWPGKSTNYLEGLIPPPENLVEGRKRPMSVMAPIMLLPKGTKCGEYVAFDNHHGYDAVSSLTEILLKNLTRQELFNNSIQSPRVSQGFYPDTVYAEKSVNSDLITYLEERKHTVQVLGDGKSIGKCSAIRYLHGNMYFYNDPRDTNNTGVQY